VRLFTRRGYAWTDRSPAPRPILQRLLNAVIFMSMTQTSSITTVAVQFLMVMQSISRSFSCLQTVSASSFCWKPAKRAR
jgi:hypothetical protein